MNRSAIPQSLVLASGNKGKIREFQAILASWNIVPQAQYDVIEAQETGCTFIENAVIKARNAARQSHKPALADDSGLVVDALQGAPGVISARYAGDGASDRQNLEKLLAQMQDVPEVSRSARFVCVIVFMRHADDPLPLIAQGVWEGRIMRQPAGENGFGYDPVFWVPDHDCSSAQLSAEVKNAISHRAQALKMMTQLMT